MKIFRNWFKRTPAPTPIVVVQHDPLADAVADLADTFGCYMTAEAGSHFTCGEADAMARVLVAGGYRDAAITWLEGHAEEDGGDDSHFVYDEDDPEDEGRALTAAELGEYVDGLLI